jgi:hypothetical protein
MCRDADACTGVFDDDDLMDSDAESATRCPTAQPDMRCEFGRSGHEESDVRHLWRARPHAGRCSTTPTLAEARP